MFSKSNQKKDVIVLGFQHIEEELRKGALTINIKVKANHYNSTKEELLKQNLKISMLLNVFFQRQEKSYIDDYITSIEQLNSNITNANFEHIMQNSDRNIQEQITQQVEDDFNEFLKNYVEKQKSRQKIREKLDNNLSELFAKAEQILTDTELQIKEIVSKDLIDQWNKLDSEYSLSSSKAYKKFVAEFKNRPEQLAFVTTLLKRVIK